MDDRHEPRAAGVLIALGAILGVVIGTPYNQTSAGLLIGLGIGIAAALILWWRDRRR